jgi:dihydrofolate synthase/folylpolyglutamate synthase
LCLKTSTTRLTLIDSVNSPELTENHEPTKSLDDWLSWLEQLHPKSIDLGLERVHQVACKLNLLKSPTSISHPYSGALAGESAVVAVAGTNGKGSCIAALEKSLAHCGRPVASYTSPHLHHYCERIRINGRPVSESLVCDAFMAIDQARDDISLTYFEFGTLAALWVFVQEKIPYVLLEVGLGGRLDAVNIVDADIAVITSIDLDHQDWLGSDRDLISKEKLGIARAQRPLVIAESELTESLALALTVYPVEWAGRDYCFSTMDKQLWQFQHGQQTYALPLPSLHLASVAAALCVMNLLGLTLPEATVGSLMPELHLCGRFEQQQFKKINIIYDVAHNPAAVGHLALRLAEEPIEGVTRAVLAVMADKDLAGLLASISGQIDHWYLGDLSDVPRAASAEHLAELLNHQQQCQQSQKNITLSSSVDDAFISALLASSAHDRIMVFGSFFTVAAVQSLVANMSSDGLIAST